MSRCKFYESGGVYTIGKKEKMSLVRGWVSDKDENLLEKVSFTGEEIFHERKFGVAIDPTFSYLTGANTPIPEEPMLLSGPGVSTLVRRGWADDETKAPKVVLIDGDIFFKGG